MIQCIDVPHEWETIDKNGVYYKQCQNCDAEKEWGECEGCGESPMIYMEKKKPKK